MRFGSGIRNSIQGCEKKKKILIASAAENRRDRGRHSGRNSAKLAESSFDFGAGFATLSEEAGK